MPNNQTQTFAATSTWVCPQGVTSVLARCWGGGGTGGPATGTASGAGGGAGGQYAEKTLAVTAGTSYTVTVAGASTAAAAAVVNGNDSWFNTSGTVIAKGGAGGANATGATSTGGTGATTGGIGDTVFAGGSGGNGVSSTQSAGGGGGAGSTGTGASGSGATPGGSTSLNGGGGGAGVASANTRNNGSNSGGGGSGGLSSSATDRSGGNGAQGLVVLEWDDPTLAPIEQTDLNATQNVPKRRASSLASIALALAFVPLVSAPSDPTGWRPTYPDAVRRPTLPRASHQAVAWYADPSLTATTDAAPSEGSPIGAPRQVQYQALAGPVVVPAVVTDPTDWRPTYPAMVRRAVRPTASQQAVAWYADPSPAVAGADISAIGSDADVPRARTLQYQSPSGPVVVPAVATPEQPFGADSGLIAPDRVVFYQDLVEPVYLDLPQWTPVYPDRLHRTASRAHFPTVTRSLEFSATAASTDVGTGGSGGEIARPRVLQYQSVSGPVVVPPVIVPANSWGPSFPARIWPARGLAAALQQTLGWHTETPPPPLSTFGGSRRGKQARGRARVRGRR